MCGILGATTAEGTAGGTLMLTGEEQTPSQGGPPLQVAEPAPDGLVSNVLDASDGVPALTDEVKGAVWRMNWWSPARGADATARGD